MSPKQYAPTAAHEHTADTGPTFIAKSKKAVAGGIAAAIAAGASALGVAGTDGNISTGELYVIAGAVVGGFLTGALAVWNAPANEI